MRPSRRLALGVVGTCSAVLSAAAPAVAGLPNETIGTARIGQAQPTTVLANSRGRTLYVYTGDRKGRVSCYGGCLAPYYKPLLTGRKALARSGSGVRQKLLGTVRRSNGQLQVAYDGHPLYTDTQDTRPGLYYGQACQGTAGDWFVVATSGNANEKLIGESSMCNGY